MQSFPWLFPLLIGLNLFLLPHFILILVTALAALFSRPGPRRGGPSRTRFLIVIPAHDEAEGIATTVRSCRGLDYPSELFQVLVIADNCTDNTALIARREGATVVERDDPSKKSKGYAIEYLIDRLNDSGQLKNFDAMVVIDADSTASPDLLHGFAGSLETGQDWIQCLYTVANPDTSWRTRLMAYAFCLFNGVTPLGQRALGLSAGFRGNGMCISTRGLERVPWNSYGLVEDMEYSWNVRIAGGKVAFIPQVCVQGVMLGQGGRAAIQQRQRWEHGRHELRRRMLLPLLQSGRLSWIEKTTSVLELTMPPMMALLILYHLVLAANLLVLFCVPMAGLSRLFLAGSSVLMSLALAIHAICPFLVFQLSWNYLLIFAYLPFYAFWKLLISFRRRPSQWVRTPREQPVNQ